eukprot:scaffold226276_cov55-Attheya_sp.AAC.1
MSKLRQRWLLGKQGETQQHHEGPIIWLLDGGVSTYLESILRRPFEHRSLWSSSLLLSSEGREAIRQCHLDFFRAGSDLASTVTYQCNYLPQHSNFDMDSMLRKGVQLTREAAEIVAAEDGRPRFVVASIGCYGSALADGSEYTGNYGDITHNGLVDFYERKVKILLEEKPDILAFETIPYFGECDAVVTVLKAIVQDTPKLLGSTTTWLSLACRDACTLNDGTHISRVLDDIDRLDPNCDYVHGIGINCCSFVHVKDLVQLIVQHMTVTNKSAPKRAIVIYPNSGEEWDAEQSQWKEESGFSSSQQFADTILEAVRTIKKQNMDIPIIVGGCCRTSPTTVQTLRKNLDSEFHPIHF